MIRHLFLSLDSIFDRLESSALAFKDTIEKAIKLKSLSELMVQVPSDCERIRNLFEFLLLDALRIFRRVISKAKI